MEEQVKTALEKQNPWWFEKKFATGIPRLSYYPQLLKYLKTKEISLLLGARRTGKSTLLYQLIKSLSVKPEAILFINLDEPLFQSKAKDPVFLRTLIEDYLVEHKDVKKFYIFIDEIQNYDFWVPTLKTLHDTSQNLKFVLTGSTSTLLQTAASTRLSGRYFSTEISPLTFKEFLAFNNVVKPTILEKKKHLKDFVQYGSFPRVVLEKDISLKQDILKGYFQTIYLKDIIYPHKLRNNRDVSDLLFFVLSNVGKLFSYIKMGKSLAMSSETVKEYLTYAQEAYLLFSVNKYDHSVRKQQANPKKIYCIDSGLINSLSFRFSESKGRLIENVVFLKLRQKYKEIFYHKDQYECDFVVKEGLKITRAVQVTTSLNDEKVRNREVRGLVEALKAHKLKRGLILTEDERGTIEKEGKKIEIKPLYEWLLEN